MHRRRRSLALAAACCLAAGCGSDPPRPGELADGSVPAVPSPVTVGSGAVFRPPPDARQLRGTGCTGDHVPRYVIHLELFAAGHIVVVPAGIGIVRPLRRSGAYVTGGRCSLALRTREPTGLVEIAHATDPTLGDLFAIWGRALSPLRLLTFTGPVRAFLDGRPVHGDPRAIELRPHAQIVLVSGKSVPVHATYRFPRGL